MSALDKAPTTLLEAVVYFSDERRAWKAFVNKRWPDGVVTCPRCNCERVHLIETRMVWRCNGCKRQFSVKVGTIFEDSPLPLSKWLPAMWLISSNKNGISSCELARALKVQQRSAWFMLHRIRLAMQTGTFEKLSGTVEADETFVGGVAKNMHKDVRERKITSRGGKDKAVVFGMMQRGGMVFTKVVKSNDRTSLLPPILKHVEAGSNLYTDELQAYRKLNQVFVHEFIDHTKEYVRDLVHTNCMENYWSLLKRGINGTYISVEPCHLFRYCDEQAYRFNHRDMGDGDRFQILLGRAVGRRLTYNELTGKESVQTVNA